MSDPTQNPYQVNQVNESPSQIESNWSGTVTAKTRLDFGTAAPWWTFLAVMSFIACGFMVLAGIALFFLGESFGNGNSTLAFMGPLVGIVYIALSAILFFPGLMTLKLGRAAKAFKKDGAASDLEAIALNSKNMALFNGIMMIVILSIYALVLIGVVVVGIVAAAGRLGN